MRSLQQRRSALALVAQGLNDCEVARRSGVPRSTVREWRTQPPRDHGGPLCATCGHPEHEFSGDLASTYSYLLGLYLGDGCLSLHPRGVYRLRITLDARYPGILDECEAAVCAVMPRNACGRTQSIGCFDIGSFSKSWGCLFPQHAPGRKHERAIVLAAWQQAIVEIHPKPLLRGLVHSDGCRHINTVRSPAGKTYRYSRYCFTNRSDDIRRIFTDACDRIGVEWRQMNRWNVSVARRASVARLDEFIGPKQ